MSSFCLNEFIHVIRTVLWFYQNLIISFDYFSSIESPIWRHFLVVIAFVSYSFNIWWLIWILCAHESIKEISITSVYLFVIFILSIWSMSSTHTRGIVSIIFVYFSLTYHNNYIVRQGGESETFSKRAIESLVKKLKESQSFRLNE